MYIRISNALSMQTMKNNKIKAQVIPKPCKIEQVKYYYSLTETKFCAGEDPLSSFKNVNN